MCAPTAAPATPVSFQLNLVPSVTFRPSPNFSPDKTSAPAPMERGASPTPPSGHPCWSWSPWPRIVRPGPVASFSGPRGQALRSDGTAWDAGAQGPGNGWGWGGRRRSRPRGLHLAVRPGCCPLPAAPCPLPTARAPLLGPACGSSKNLPAPGARAGRRPGAGRVTALPPAAAPAHGTSRNSWRSGWPGSRQPRSLRAHSIHRLWGRSRLVPPPTRLPTPAPPAVTSGRGWHGCQPARTPYPPRPPRPTLPSCCLGLSPAPLPLPDAVQDTTGRSVASPEAPAGRDSPSWLPMTLTAMRGAAGRPRVGLPLTLLTGLLWARGFGEEDHRGEVTLSSIHVTGTLSTPLTQLTLTLVTWRLRTLFSRPLPPSLRKDSPRSTASRRR